MGDRSSTRAALPQERIDVVIDNLDNKSAAVACSLVCKAWLPPARRNIFRTLSISSHNLAVLSQLVNDQSSTALTYVRQLYVSNLTYLHSQMRDAVFAIFCGIAVRTKLKLLHMTIFESEFAKFDAIAPSLASVTDFALRLADPFDTDHDRSATISLVSTLPMLRSLCLSGNVDLAPALKQQATTFPHLHTLGVAVLSVRLDDLLSGLVSQSFPGLRTVSIICTQATADGALHRFLQSVAPTLQHLIVARILLFGLDLSAYTHLRTLYIIVHSDHCQSRIADMLVQAMTHLAHLDAVWFDFTRLATTFTGWDEIDAAMVQFTPRVRLCVVVAFDEQEEDARSCFTQCFMRGVAEVVHPHPDMKLSLWRPWLNFCQ